MVISIRVVQELYHLSLMLAKDSNLTPLETGFLPFVKGEREGFQIPLNPPLLKGEINKKKEGRKPLLDALANNGKLVTFARL